MMKLPVVAQAQINRLERAKKFDAELQIELNEVKTRTTCSKGCSHCCYHPRLISILEGISLYRSLYKHHLWSSVLKKQLEDHQTKTWNLAPEVWLLSTIGCPLLQDGMCVAYEARPLSCRICYSTGDPYLCHPLRLTEGSGIVNRAAAMEEHMEAEQRLLRRFKLRNIPLPISSAVLLGERIDKGDIRLEDFTTSLSQNQAELG